MRGALHHEADCQARFDFKRLLISVRADRGVDFAKFLTLNWGANWVKRLVGIDGVSL